MEEERRQRSLTVADIEAISELIANKPVCSLGLDVNDAAIIKGHIRTWKKATSIIGSVILTAIAILIVGIFTKGFWVSLIEGIKK